MIERYGTTIKGALVAGQYLVVDEDNVLVFRRESVLLRNFKVTTKPALAQYGGQFGRAVYYKVPNGLPVALHIMLEGPYGPRPRYRGRLLALRAPRG